MLDVAPTSSAVLNLPLPACATGSAIAEIVADLSGGRKLAVLVPDALGALPWRQWRREMPFLNSLHGERSIILRSILPSYTPVNFACMLTGAELAVHGVRLKTDTFACETLFDVVRSAGGTSAGVGSEGHTGCELVGRHADLWGKGPPGSDAGVEEAVIEIADRDGPMFLIAQFYQTDYHFHLYGPSSPLVVPTLRDTDARLQRVTEHLKRLGYAMLILADHGQHDVAGPGEGQRRGDHGTDCMEDCLAICTWL